MNIVETNALLIRFNAAFCKPAVKYVREYTCMSIAYQWRL